MKLKNTIEKSRIGYDTIDTKISIFPRTIIFTANNIHSTFGLWHIILFAARRTYARPIVRIHAFTKKHDSPWTKEREREREKERKREKKIIKRGKNSTWYIEYIRVWRLRGGTLGSASRRSRTPWSQHMPRASDRKPLSTSHEIRSFDESIHCT